MFMFLLSYIGFLCKKTRLPQKILASTWTTTTYSLVTPGSKQVPNMVSSPSYLGICPLWFYDYITTLFTGHSSDWIDMNGFS